MRVVAAADFASPPTALLGLAILLALLWCTAFAVRYVASFPKQPDPGPETGELGPEPPAVANLLANRFRLGRPAVAATLVDLAARRLVGLEQVASDRYVVRTRTRPDEDLLDHERAVLVAVRARATGGSAPLDAIDLGSSTSADSWWERFDESVVADARARGLARSRWSRADWILLGTVAAGALACAAAALALARPAADDVDPEGWFVYAGVLWALLMLGVSRLTAIRDTPEGRAAAARWLGVRAHFEANPSFADASPASVVIWGRSLAYAVALGAARTAAEALALGAEDPGLAWTRRGATWHQVRVEYPSRFGYGEAPLGVLAGGVLRLLFWGAVAFVLLPVVLRETWRTATDLLPGSASGGAELALTGAFLLLFGVLGGLLVVRLADGALRTWRGAADLGAPVRLEGRVIKLGADDRRGWVAIDEGTDEVRAWRRPDEAPSLRLGDRVAVTLTRRLRHVTRVEVSSAARPAET
jgi:hypothetical protein